MKRRRILPLIEPVQVVEPAPAPKIELPAPPDAPPASAPAPPAPVAPPASAPAPPAPVAPPAPAPAPLVRIEHRTIGYAASPSGEPERPVNPMRGALKRALERTAEAFLEPVGETAFYVRIGSIEPLKAVWDVVSAGSDESDDRDWKRKLHLISTAERSVYSNLIEALEGAPDQDTLLAQLQQLHATPAQYTASRDTAQRQNAATRALVDRAIDLIAARLTNLTGYVDGAKTLLDRLVERATSHHAVIGPPIELTHWVWQDYYDRLIQATETGVLDPLIDETPQYVLLSEIGLAFNQLHNNGFDTERRGANELMSHQIRQMIDRLQPVAAETPVSFVTAPAGAGKTTTIISALVDLYKTDRYNSPTAVFLFNRGTRDQAVADLYAYVRTRIDASRSGPLMERLKRLVDIRTVDSAANVFAREPILKELISGINTSHYETVMRWAYQKLHEAFYRTDRHGLTSLHYALDPQAQLETTLVRLYKRHAPILLGDEIIRKESLALIPPIPLIREMRQTEPLPSPDDDGDVALVRQVLGLIDRGKDETGLHRWVYDPEVERPLIERLRNEPLMAPIVSEKELSGQDALTRNGAANLNRAFQELAVGLALRALQRMVEPLLTVALHDKNVRGGSSGAPGDLNRWIRATLDLSALDFLARYRAVLLNHLNLSEHELKDILSSDPLHLVLANSRTMTMAQVIQGWYSQAVQIGSIWAMLILAQVIRGRFSDSVDASSLPDLVDLLRLVEPSYSYAVNHLALGGYAARRDQALVPPTAGFRPGEVLTYIVDEAQDASSPFLLYLIRLARDSSNAKKVRVLIVGDPNQQINRHAGNTYLMHWLTKSSASTLHEPFREPGAETPLGFDTVSRLGAYHRNPGYGVITTGAALARLVERFVRHEPLRTTRTIAARGAGESRQSLGLWLDADGRHHTVKSTYYATFAIEWRDQREEGVQERETDLQLIFSVGYPISEREGYDIYLRVYPHPARRDERGALVPIDYDESQPFERLVEQLESTEEFLLAFEVATIRRGPAGEREVLALEHATTDAIYNTNAYMYSGAQIAPVLNRLLMNAIARARQTHESNKDVFRSELITYLIDSSWTPAPTLAAHRLGATTEPTVQSAVRLPIVAIRDRYKSSRRAFTVYALTQPADASGASIPLSTKRMEDWVSSEDERGDRSIGFGKHRIDPRLSARLMAPARNVVEIQGQAVVEDTIKQALIVHLAQMLGTQPDVSSVVFHFSFASATPALSQTEGEPALRWINLQHELDFQHYENLKRQIRRLHSFTSERETSYHETETPLHDLLRIPQLIHRMAQVQRQEPGRRGYHPTIITLTNAGEYVLPIALGVANSAYPDETTRWLSGLPVNAHRYVKGATLSDVIVASPLFPYYPLSSVDYVAATRPKSFQFDESRTLKFDPKRLIAPFQELAVAPDATTDPIDLERRLTQLIPPSGPRGFAAQPFQSFTRLPYWYSQTEDPFPTRDESGALRLPELILFEADQTAVKEWLDRASALAPSSNRLAYWRALVSLSASEYARSAVMDRKAMGKRYGDRRVISPLRVYLTNAANLNSRRSTIQIRVVSTLGALMDKLVETKRQRVAEPLIQAGLILPPELDSKGSYQFSINTHAIYGAYAAYSGSVTTRSTVWVGAPVKASDLPVVERYRNTLMGGQFAGWAQRLASQDSPALPAPLDEHLIVIGDEVRFRNPIYAPALQELERAVPDPGKRRQWLLDFYAKVEADPRSTERDYPELTIAARFVQTLDPQANNEPIGALVFLETIAPAALVSVPRKEFTLYTRMGELTLIQEPLDELTSELADQISDEDEFQLRQIAELLDEGDAVWSNRNKVRETVQLIIDPIDLETQTGRERAAERLERYWSETMQIATGSGPIKEVHDVVEMQYAMAHSSAVGDATNELVTLRAGDWVATLPTVGVPFGSVVSNPQLFETVVQKLPEAERKKARSLYDQVRAQLSYSTRAMGAPDPMLLLLTGVYDALERALETYPGDRPALETFHALYTQQDNGQYDSLDADAVADQVIGLAETWLRSHGASTEPLETLRTEIAESAQAGSAAEPWRVWRALWSLYQALRAPLWMAYLARYPFLFPSSALVVPARVTRHPTIVTPNVYYWAMNGDSDGDRLVIRLIEPVGEGGALGAEYATMLRRLAHMAVYNPIESESDAALNMTPLAEGHAAHAAWMSVIWGASVEAYDDLLENPTLSQTLELDDAGGVWTIREGTDEDTTSQRLTSLAAFRAALIERGALEPSGFDPEPIWRIYRSPVSVVRNGRTITVRGNVAWGIWLIMEGLRAAGAETSDLDDVWDWLVEHAAPIENGWRREQLLDLMIDYTERKPRQKPKTGNAETDRIRRLSHWHGFWLLSERPSNLAVAPIRVDGSNPYDGDRLAKKGELTLTPAMAARYESLRAARQLPKTHVLENAAIRDEFARLHAGLDYAFRLLHGYAPPSPSDPRRWLGWAYEETTEDGPVWYGYYYEPAAENSIRVYRVALDPIAHAIPPRRSVDAASWDQPEWATPGQSAPVEIGLVTPQWILERAALEEKSLPEWARAPLRNPLWTKRTEARWDSIGARAITMITRYLLYRTMQWMVAEAEIHPGLRTIMENNPYDASSFNTKRITALLEKRLPGMWHSTGDPRLSFLWAPQVGTARLKPLALAGRSVRLERNAYTYTTNYDVESGGLVSKGIQASGVMIDPGVTIPDPTRSKEERDRYVERSTEPMMVSWAEWAPVSPRIAYGVLFVQGTRQKFVPSWRRSTYRIVGAALEADGFDLGSPIQVSWLDTAQVMTPIETTALGLQAPTRALPIRAAPATTYAGTDVLTDRRQALAPHAESNKLTQILIDLFKRIGYAVVFESDEDNPAYAHYMLAQAGLVRAATVDARPPGSAFNPVRGVGHIVAGALLRDPRVQTDPNRFFVFAPDPSHATLTAPVVTVRGGVPPMFAPLFPLSPALGYGIDPTDTAQLSQWERAASRAPRRFEALIRPAYRNALIVAVSPGALMAAFREQHALSERLGQESSDPIKPILRLFRALIDEGFKLLDSIDRSDAKIVFVVTRDLATETPLDQQRYLDRVIRDYAPQFESLRNELDPAGKRVEFVYDPSIVFDVDGLVVAYNALEKETETPLRAYRYGRDRKIAAMVASAADLHLTYYGAAISPLSEVGALFSYSVAPLGFTGFSAPIAVFDGPLGNDPNFQRYRRHLRLGYIAQRAGLIEQDGTTPLERWLARHEALVSETIRARVGEENLLDREALRGVFALGGLDPAVRAAMVQMLGVVHPALIVRSYQAGLSGGAPRKYLGPIRFEQVHTEARRYAETRQSAPAPAVNPSSTRLWLINPQVVDQSTWEKLFTDLTDPDADAFVLTTSVLKPMGDPKRLITDRVMNSWFVYQTADRATTRLAWRLGDVVYVFPRVAARHANGSNHAMHQHASIVTLLTEQAAGKPPNTSRSALVNLKDARVREAIAKRTFDWRSALAPVIPDEPSSTEQAPTVILELRSPFDVHLIDQSMGSILEALPEPMDLYLIFRTESRSE